ncbi:methionyl-tRNA synthetase [Candidatus Termititenax persephonae]|uniref:Methionine--tRNA ligase n=1 Tax=Candidatus Termititenax persephonae TaxID=2218525 RepID=A0A388THB9_9BACT|nr:methionyl-tRNA synthetase [Candidatus Termititenax persephonae]
MRKILVTSALPYANGSIHLGHLVEYIQTDIWVRFQKLSGHECLFVCADDTHGTPIMLSAKRGGITPEELIARMQREHTEDFQAFNISFDNYYSTHSPENKELSEMFYAQAQAKGLIEEKEISQAYCEKCQLFLPDRFIKGTCPRCGAEEQYGDSCEVCSATYAPTELKDAHCTECGAKPVQKNSQHYFFKLSALDKELLAWVKAGHIQPEIYNKLMEWFQQGLRDWDISRDAPYFGFPIPGADNKFFYVWLDAPIGYIASTQNYCAKINRDFADIWRRPGWEIHHFIGKDILYFHTLFWPALLMAAGLQTPRQIHIHGFLTINGEKMSKSRGTFISARQYLEAGLNPEYLRYYFASKLGGSLNDIDLNIGDFAARVNSDLVNKLVNIGSRLGSLVHKQLDGTLAKPDAAGQKILDEIRAAQENITRDYEELELHKAMREIMRLADTANKYINDSTPWNTVKTDPAQAAQICTSGLNCLKILTAYIKPVLPIIAAGVEKFLNCGELTFQNAGDLLLDHKINAYEHLAQRIDEADVNKKLLG